MSMSIEEVRAEAYQRIREIQDRYRREIKPLIKILTDIEAMNPIAPVIIDFMALSEDQRNQWIERLKSSGVLPDEAS